MKLSSNVNYIDKYQLPDEIKYFIDPASVRHITSILRNLYSDPIRAIIREYSINAVEAHMLVGKEDVPIDIYVPDGITDSTLQFRDYGPGLSDDDVRQLLFGYGKSGEYKRQSNLFPGGFGVGCKCAFAITQQFTYISYHNGYKSVWCCYLNEDDDAVGALVSKEPSTEPSGIHVIIPVKKELLPDIYSCLKTQFLFFKVKPRLFGNIPSDVLRSFNSSLNFPIISDTICVSDKAGNQHIIKFEKYLTESKFDTFLLDSDSCYVVMGMIAYPVDIDKILNTGRIKLNDINLQDVSHTTSGYLNWHYAHLFHGVVLYADVNTFLVAPSREELQYTPRMLDLFVLIFNQILKKYYDYAATIFENPAYNWRRRFEFFKFLVSNSVFQNELIKLPQYRFYKDFLHQPGNVDLFNFQAKVLLPNSSRFILFEEEIYDFISFTIKSDKRFMSRSLIRDKFMPGQKWGGKLANQLIYAEPYYKFVPGEFKTINLNDSIFLNNAAESIFVVVLDQTDILNNKKQFFVRLLHYLQIFPDKHLFKNNKFIINVLFVSKCADAEWLRDGSVFVIHAEALPAYEQCSDALRAFYDDALELSDASSETTSQHVGFNKPLKNKASNRSPARAQYNYKFNLFISDLNKVYYSKLSPYAAQAPASQFWEPISVKNVFSKDKVLWIKIDKFCISHPLLGQVQNNVFARFIAKIIEFPEFDLLKNTGIIGVRANDVNSVLNSKIGKNFVHVFDYFKDVFTEYYKAHNITQEAVLTFCQLYVLIEISYPLWPLLYSAYYWPTNDPSILSKTDPLSVAVQKYHFMLQPLFSNKCFYFFAQQMLIPLLHFVWKSNNNDATKFFNTYILPDCKLNDYALCTYKFSYKRRSADGQNFILNLYNFLADDAELRNGLMTAVSSATPFVPFFTFDEYLHDPLYTLNKLLIDTDLVKLFGTFAMNFTDWILPALSNNPDENIFDIDNRIYKLYKMFPHVKL